MKSTRKVEEEITPIEKYKLLNRVKNLSEEGMGQIIELILEECPTAYSF